MKPANVRALGLKLNIEEWESIYNTNDVDEKVQSFTAKLVEILDETVPERSICAHPTDKPWITTEIKWKIKSKQRAFSKGDTTKYKHISVIVSTLIAKAKKSYYLSEVQVHRKRNPAKWYKSIYNIAGANDNQGQTSSPEAVIYSVYMQAN